MTLSRRQLLQLSGYGGLGLAANMLVSKHSRAQAMSALTMQLDWKFNVQFAGLLLADGLGLYSAEGVAVDLRPWESGVVVPEVVAANPSVIGCAEQNLILAAQADGAPIKAVATMFQASPLGLMTLPDSEISTLEDLIGKKVGMHIDGLAVMALVQGASDLGGTAIDVVEIPYESKYDLLLSGELAAIQCYAVDEPLGFANQYQVVPNVLKLADYGYEAYAQVIFAHNELIATAPEQISGFLRGTFGGWAIALEDIPAAASTVVADYVEPGSKYKDVAYQTASLELISEYMLLGIEHPSLGIIDSDRWMRMAEQFVVYNIIETVPSLEASLTQEFWPVT